MKKCTKCKENKELLDRVYQAAYTSIKVDRLFGSNILGFVRRHRQKNSCSGENDAT